MGFQGNQHNRLGVSSTANHSLDNSLASGSKMRDPSASAVETKDTGGKIAQTFKTSKPKEKIIDKYLPSDYILYDEKYEFSFNKISSVVRVKGRLKLDANCWHSIGCYHYIIKVVGQGYVIPFLTKPDSQFLKNNQSALKHAEFIDEAVLELLISDRIREVDSPPHGD